MSDASPSESTATIELEQFHDGLRAALMSQVPLELGKSKSLSSPRGTANSNKLTRLENAVSDRLTRGQSLASVLDDDNWLPDRYRASLGIFERIGELPIVLEGLATRARSRRQLSRLLRSTTIYLLAVIFIGYTGLIFFSESIMPSFDNMRADMQLAPVVDAPQRADGMALLRWALLAFPLGLLFVTVIVPLIGGPGMIAAWLGGRRYQTHRESATAVRAIRALVSNGTPVGEAVSLSCTLVGNAAAVRRQVAGSVRDGPMDSASLDYLQGLADHYQASAANRMAVLRVVLPIALVSLLGGAAVMSYALSLFLPIVAMLKDLALPGI